MNQITQKPHLIKERMKTKILYNCPPLDKLLFMRLNELRKSLRLKEDSFIPYSNIREKICKNFSINKNQLKEIIEFFTYSRFIICSPKGIKLNFQVQE